MRVGLRGAVLLGVAAVLVVAAAALVLDLGGSPYDRAESSESTLSVADALRQAPAEPVPVTGFAFGTPGRGEVRLCDARERGDPPVCVGPILRLHGLAVDRIAFEVGATPEGETVRWSPGAVVLLGRVRGDLLEVTEVLS